LIIKKNQDKKISAMTALALVSILLLLLLPSLLFANRIEATSATIPIVSTRHHFGLSSGDLRPGYSNIEYDPPSVIPSCSSNREVVVYIHGWNADEQSAISQFNTVKRSLESVGYNQPVIGFSWDSDTFDWWDVQSWSEGWPVAKDIAQQNGLKLAKFILDYKAGCENAEIRLVGHSLGARVIINALYELHTNRDLVTENDISWNDPNKNYKIASVHLLGAAINPEEVSIAQGFGIPISVEVNQFYNKYSTEDTVLEEYYRDFEGGNIALGEEGAQGMAAGLRNIYHEQEVSSEIPLDRNGDSRFTIPPDKGNHMGYAGIVDRNGIWIGEGVMDVVVTQDWRNQ
jgi:pimeloyl-ACP methyl ester carboxylesterase